MPSITANLKRLSKLLDPPIRAKNMEAVRLAIRERYWSISHGTMPDPIFLIGCSRSGTTVTFETLAASGHFRHFNYELPQLWDAMYGPLNNNWASESAGPEHALPAHRDKAFAYFFARLGRGQILDKTCINTLRVGYLHALFPGARFVFIHRDGRDNISSMIDGWRLGRTDGGFGLEKFFGPSPEPVAINGGEFPEWHFFLPPGWRNYNHASLEDVCAFQWITANRLALDAAKLLPSNQWIQVRYEDIFDRPVEMFRTVFERLGVPFGNDMRERCANLIAKPTSVVKGKPMKAKWKDSNPEAIERILPAIAPTMRELGYDPED